SATSRAMEPVGMTATGARSSLPSRMTEPFPNWRSIWARADSRDFSRSAGVGMTCSSCVRVVPPVGCRGCPGWGGLSDKAYGFSACIHRTRGHRHRVGTPANGGIQHIETTCAERYAHFEHFFDDTPKAESRGIQLRRGS